MATCSDPAASARRLTRDEIVLEHLKLVKSIAARLRPSLPPHVDFDDLVQAGTLGLLDAVEKFDPEMEVAFSSFAKHRIRGAMLDSLRALDLASRQLRRRRREAEAVIRELANSLSREPTSAEIAEKLGLELEAWHKLVTDFQSVEVISASARPGGEDPQPAPDFPCKPEMHPDSVTARKQMGLAIRSAMTTMSVRHQEVVVRYYNMGMTMKEIGVVMDINESRVSQLHKASLGKMREALRADGIDSIHKF